MDADDGGIDLAQRCVIDAEHRRLVAAGIVGHCLGGFHQPVQDVLPLRRFEIEGDRPLVEVEGLVEQAVVVAEEERPGGAGGIAALWWLDLDDLRPQLGKEHRSVRPGAILFEAEDADAGEGEVGHLL